MNLTRRDAQVSGHIFDKDRLMFYGGYIVLSTMTNSVT